MHLKADTLLQGDKYRIISTLGQGGFGITYLAEQVLVKRKVCIKEFFPKEYYNRDEDSHNVSLGSMGSAAMMDAFKAKFIKEAKTIAHLNHPNIIHIHDVFTENNTAYYVMEYVEGESLSQLVRRNGALDEERAVGYVRTVALALDYIHERKIMHLDIKPANIMLRAEDDSPILIDFGLAKQYDDTGEQTSSTPVGISHGYAPMEQYQAGGVKGFSPSTDIYSLGATLYFLVSGNVPPAATTVGEEGIGKLPEHLSSSTCTTIERAMSYWRKDRPKSIKEFMMLLENHLPKVVVHNEDTVIEVKKTTPKPQKQTNRKWLWLILAAVTALIIGGIAMFQRNDTPESEKGVTSTRDYYDSKGKCQPDNEIWYTSKNGKIVKPQDNVFGVNNIVSNTYENGKGIITFDSSLKTIGVMAFDFDDSLTSVTIPNSVTTIEEYAFTSCSNLTSVTIPNSVKKIGPGVFSGCDSIKEFKGKFAADGGRCLISDKTFIAYAHASGSSYTILPGVTAIGVGAFSNCKSLTSVTIPNSVTTIGEYAFSYCSNLTSITIPNHVSTIGESTFSNCTSLTYVSIPNSVTEIGLMAFFNCSSLTSITIPDYVKRIGDMAFAYCSNLKTVYCKATIPPQASAEMFICGDNPFEGTKHINCTIYVPRQSVNAYKNANGWKEYANQIVGYDF